MTRDAEMSATDYVRLVLANVGAETDAFGIKTVPAYAAMAVHTFTAPEHRAELWLDWEQGLRKLLESADPGSDHQLTFVRAYAAAAHTEQAVADLEALLDGTLSFDGLAIDADLRWLLLEGLAHTGHADEQRIAEELAADNTISGQEHAAACLAARPTAEAKAAAWEQAMLDPATPNATQRSVSLAFNKPGQAEVLQPYVEKYLAGVGSTWDRLGSTKAAVALEFMFPRLLASAELLEQLDAWLETASANPGALRKVTEGRADVARALAAQAKDAERD
jgi:aminopeptidase N